MFIAHALLKLLVFTLPGTVKFFEMVGYPGFIAYVVVAAELIGGGLLVLGVYTCWVAAGVDHDPARRRPGARTQRLGVQRAERRLGVSGVPGRGVAGADSDR